jgi:hypothetical protein
MRALLLLAVVVQVAHCFLTPAEIKAIHLSKELANERPSSLSFKHSLKPSQYQHHSEAANSRLAQRRAPAAAPSRHGYSGNDNDLTFFPSDVPTEMRQEGRRRVSMLSSAWNQLGRRDDMQSSRRRSHRHTSALDSSDAMRLADELSSQREIEEIGPAAADGRRRETRYVVVVLNAVFPHRVIPSTSDGVPATWAMCVCTRLLDPCPVRAGTLSCYIYINCIMLFRFFCTYTHMLNARYGTCTCACTDKHMHTWLLQSCVCMHVKEL